jgi:D-methionine transport system ATP-binding protein
MQLAGEKQLKRDRIFYCLITPKQADSFSTNDFVLRFFVMLELKNISVSVGSPTKEILKELSFSIKKGEITALLGLSGAGKSTALRTINLLQRPSAGEVIVDGKNLLTLSSKELLKERQNIGMIFQHFNLINNSTVFENIAFPLSLTQANKASVQTRVYECLELVGLSDKASSYPSQLSGGQKQRVSIARALANNPKYLLADEPTSALDPLTKIEVLNYLKKINNELGITIVIATHDMSVVKKICHKAILLKDQKVHEILNIQNEQIIATTDYAKSFLEMV